MSYLEKLLPAEECGGYYCVAKVMPGGIFANYFVPTIQEAESLALRLSAAGENAFIAQAMFDRAKIDEAKAWNAAHPDAPKSERKKRRAQINATYLRNFFVDIDCGEKWILKDQKEGAAALKQFVAETGLPFPAVVSSGNGLYAQWLIEENIPADQWRTIAKILKSTLAAHSKGLADDSSRTADSASVLRPPGTTNRKPGKDPKPVSLLKDMEPIPFMTFVQALAKAAKKKGVDTTATKPPKPVSDLNAEFYAGVELREIPSSGAAAASKCAQLRWVQTARGNVPEPVWYAALGVAIFCEEKDELIQSWSDGHPDYTPEASIAKAQQYADSGTGPATCAHFGHLNPEGCIGCRHSGKIKSPIVLGRPEPEAKVVEKIEEEPPFGFRRSDRGLFADVEGEWKIFYDCDLYPVRLAYDESLGYETATIRHHLPHEGWLEFTMRSSLVHDAKAMMTALADNHVKVVGGEGKKHMMLYVESYLQKLQRQRKMSSLFCQMGWKEVLGKPVFVLGTKIFREGQEPDEASLAKNVPNAALGYRSEGSLEAWAQTTELFKAPGMEPFAFALLAGGFGAPLMKFTGYDGAMISLTGDSGTGKTLLLRMIQSVWGHHNDLMMLRDDTKNALVSRLGVYGNLPLTVDEVTNIDGMELSDLVYRITQGRDKARLTKSAEERKVLNTWNTLAVVTTNASLSDKLAGAKHDANAELNRVFEFYVPPHPTFQGDVTTGVYWAIDKNFGVAGEVYAQWLVDNLEKIKPGIDRIRAIIDAASQAKAEERYWSAIAAVAIYGGMVAQSLGIIRFPVASLIEWTAACIRGMRKEKVELVNDAAGILGQFIDEYSGHRLLVRGGADKLATVIEPPRGALVIRQEVDTQRAYIARHTFRTWITKRFGNYNQVKDELTRKGALKNAKARKVLGAGTPYSGAQQDCWEIDLACSALGSVGLYLVQDAEMLARAPQGNLSDPR